MDEVKTVNIVSMEKETPVQLQEFWNLWQADHVGFARFIIPGVGQIFSDLSKEESLPAILFDDGELCQGLERSTWEVAALGYIYGNNRRVFANFIHESAHLFISNKLDNLVNSVQTRAAKGCHFKEDSKCLDDAIEEETLVIGFQVYLNGVTSEQVSGFQFFLAEGAKRYVKWRFINDFNLDIAALKDEFIEILLKSNKN